MDECNILILFRNFYTISKYYEQKARYFWIEIVSSSNLIGYIQQSDTSFLRVSNTYKKSCNANSYLIEIISTLSLVEESFTKDHVWHPK